MSNEVRKGKVLTNNLIQRIRQRLTLVVVDETGMSTVEYEVIWTLWALQQVRGGVAVV